MTATTRQRLVQRLKQAAALAVLGGVFLWCVAGAQGQVGSSTPPPSSIGSGSGGFNPNDQFGGGSFPQAGGGIAQPGALDPSGGFGPGDPPPPGGPGAPGGFGPPGGFKQPKGVPPGVGFGPGFGPGMQPFAPFAPNPNATLRELLPVAPKQQPEAAPLLSDDLTTVPELLFQEPLAKTLTPQQWEQEMIKVFGKIRQLNKNETDGFMKAMLPRRADLSGLPIVMGDACRMKNDESQKFQLGLNVLRSFMKKFGGGTAGMTQKEAEHFWTTYQKAFANEKTKAKLGELGPAHIAGLVQVLATESAPVRAGLVRFLAASNLPEAGRALAKLAVFTPEAEVRQLAARALQGRPAADYTDILMAGLKHPWPGAARNAAQALVLLERTDLALLLADMLDDPDPRLPVARSVNGQEAFEVKHLVKLNHNNSCLICHPPADSKTPATAVMAPVPVPGKPLSSFSQGYGMSKPQPSDNDIIVRVDVTYLRQDFSLVLNVPNAKPWPEKQRFDFVVRTVPLTAAQAKAFQEKLQPKDGGLTPYQQALVTTLRGLTGLDAAPTPQAWKKAMHLPS